MQGSLVDALNFVRFTMSDDDRQHTPVMSDLDRRVLARTLWAECRGEPVDGQQAVANVIANRCALSTDTQPKWWGVGWLGVCLKPWQFSCHNKFTTADNPADHARTFLLSLHADPRQFWLAEGVLRGHLADLTDGATHYHTTAVSPAWMTDLEETCRIGAHVFYR